MPMYRLQEITAMKLNCMKIENKALESAIEAGHEKEVVACRLQIKQLQYEAMHPGESLASAMMNVSA